MTTITLEQAQEVINALHSRIREWKKIKEIFAKRVAEDRNNQVAIQVDMLLASCIREIEISLGATHPPRDQKTELLDELRLLIKKYDEGVDDGE